ncbi:HlyC/CorC family transporter [Pseudohongiella spirulinae]|uniref:Membrane protein n=1 Tax=Pseudohongiella spirulinae TaxID=1249552 RepID=A0A0S2KC70_9GAMM|nr:HlyC/CorC family transporter [Pseudohongiella spirulinae]ALO45899.1 membrane protein [Pseudohongiella spirulinae]
MDADSTVPFLTGLLIFLVFASAYFSSSETSMMSLNRYRLKHLVRQKHHGAMRVSRLLEAPDKLLGVILIGNNFVNLLSASIATSIAIQVFGNPETVLTTVVLTLVILIFAEITPKTIAALHPERIAYPSSLLLVVLLKVLYPLVWMANRVSHLLIRAFGINSVAGNDHQLSPEELRTVVHESAQMIPAQGQGMLLNVLDLEKVTVNDILVPRSEITGIDLEDDVNDILTQIGNTQHTRLPVYKKDIDHVVGVLHMRSVGKLVQSSDINREDITRELDPPYFIPESTPLHTQLFNFQSNRKRLAFVVDEYGDIKGIITLEDILEEIVGEFTTDIADSSLDVHPQADGTYLIDGTATLREINRALDWELDSDTAKTLNGLIVENLESIPDSPVGLQMGEYFAEIVQVKDNLIKTARMWRQPAAEPDHESDG